MAAQTLSRTPTQQDLEERLKVLIVDDHPLVREAMARVLPQLGDHVETVQADSVKGALVELNAHPETALIILELTLPDGDGISGIKRLRTSYPDVPVVVFSGTDNQATVLSALKNGAKGFISKRSTSAVLVSALRLVLAGEPYIPLEALRDESFKLTVPEADLPDVLAPYRTPDKVRFTRRQSEVLRLLVQGKSNKAICRELGVSTGTVKTHTAAIFRTLRVSNRTQAVCMLNRLGVELPLPPGSVAATQAVAAKETQVDRAVGTRFPRFAIPVPA